MRFFTPIILVVPVPALLVQGEWRSAASYSYFLLVTVTVIVIVQLLRQRKGRA